MSTTSYSMTFLSLAPVASPSTSLQASTKTPVTEESKAEAVEATLVRANSTGSDTSDISTSGGEGAKQMRFLKLGHHDGDWSEEVIEA